MKTTKQDYEKFKGFCLEWQRDLGLDDWHIYFLHKKLEGSYADTSYHVSSRAASTRFNTSWDEFRAPTIKDLKECALHEVMHIVTAPLMAEAFERHTTAIDIDSAEHGLVVRMTNYITRVKA